jgi:hypothetical protein
MQASSKDLTGIGTKHRNIARPKNQQKIAMDSSVRSQSWSNERHSRLIDSL